MTTLASVAPVSTIRLTSAEYTLIQAFVGKRYSRVGSWKQEVYRKGETDERLWSIVLKLVQSDKSEKKVVFKIHFCVDSSVIEFYGSEEHRAY